jgi:hypothetical protein
MVAKRIVRVVAARLLVAVAAGQLEQRHGGGHVERAVLRLLLDRLVHGRLEAAQVGDHPGVADLADLARVQLDIVWLGARLGQVAHADRLGADPLAEELQGVERGHHVEPAVGETAGGIVAAAPREAGRHAHGQQRGECSALHNIHGRRQ